MKTARESAQALLDAIELRRANEHAASSVADLRALYAGSKRAAREFLEVAMPDSEERAYLISRLDSAVVEKRVAEIAKKVAS